MLDIVTVFHIDVANDPHYTHIVGLSPSMSHIMYSTVGQSH